MTGDWIDPPIHPIFFCVRLKECTYSAEGHLYCLNLLMSPVEKPYHAQCKESMGDCIMVDNY
jgi:hypothetical protein